MIKFFIFMCLSVPYLTFSEEKKEISKEFVSQENKKTLTILADQVEYTKNSDQCIAQGHVKIIDRALDKTRTLTARKVVVHFASLKQPSVDSLSKENDPIEQKKKIDYVEAFDEVHLHQGETLIQGDYLKFSIASQEGKIYGDVKLSEGKAGHFLKGSFGKVDLKKGLYQVFPSLSQHELDILPSDVKKHIEKHLHHSSEPQQVQALIMRTES